MKRNIIKSSKLKEASKQMEEIEIQARKKLLELRINQELLNNQSNLSRARSISVGTSFGGTTEIMMRGEGGAHMWTPMQPVEVVELIYQLAANVGCSAFLKPREDFASWRDWKVTQEEKDHLNGHPPFVNDMAEFQQLGSNMEKFEQLKLEKLHDAFRAHSNIEFDENLNIKNQIIFKNGKEHMLGGRGGESKPINEAIEKFKKSTNKKYYKSKEKNEKNSLATEEQKDGRKS